MLNRATKNNSKNMNNNQKLFKKGIWLEYFTVGYNIIEGLVSVFAGIVAGSVSLVGFGLDSFIESISGTVLVWRLKNHSDNDEKEKNLERKAVKYVAYSFFILAVYVAYEAIKKLYFKEMPEGSMLGIIIATLSVIIMPFLANQKRKVGEKIRSRALIADSRETVACVYLSVTLLIGLLLNYFFGLWWADPVASLIIVGFLVNEGRECLEEKEV
jgi:divalent metal cation (Fe/Co/Zn/Cd) transporter